MYADDTLVIASKLENLPIFLNIAPEVSTAFGLNLNLHKSKYMVIGKNRLTYRPLIRLKRR